MIFFFRFLDWVITENGHLPLSLYLLQISKLSLRNQFYLQNFGKTNQFTKRLRGEAAVNTNLRTMLFGRIRHISYVINVSELFNDSSTSDYNRISLVCLDLIMLFFKSNLRINLDYVMSKNFPAFMHAHFGPFECFLRKYATNHNEMDGIAD